MARIAIDAMGGDIGVSATIGGVEKYLASKDSCACVSFDFFGKEDLIAQEVAKTSRLKNFDYCITSCEKVIESDMRPALALRNGKCSSMLEAISSVADGKNDAVVSSGNTGAYMALSKIMLKMIDGIERPALMSLLPSFDGRSVVLDLGANVDCGAKNLIQFAIMGDAAAKILLNKKDPSVALLNIGVEKNKGTEAIRSAGAFLEARHGMNYVGFIEGNDIFMDKADVIVCDGFSGNIALKTIEGTIKFLGKLLKKGINDSIRGKVSYLFGAGIANSIKLSIDPRNHNGASLVGLNGIAIKSHGNSDSVGFAHAVCVANDLASSRFVENIKEAIENTEMESCDVY